MAGASFRTLTAQRSVLVPSRLARRLRGVLGAGRLPGRITTFRAEVPTPDELRTTTALVLWHREPSRLCSLALDHAPRLEWIHSLWTGLEHLPLGRLLQRRITVSTGAGVSSGPLAEWAVLAVLWSAKRVAEHDARWRSGAWEPLEAREVAGGRAVVVGLGNVGRAVAGRLAGLGAEVVGVRRAARPAPGCRKVVAPARLAQACHGATALVVAVPLTNETSGMIGSKVLRGLADGAVVVNLGRGGVVVEEALFAEVASGRLAAALDVWWQEPVPPDSRWRGLPNVLPSPHGAYLTGAFRDRHAARVAENVRRYLEGRRLEALAPRREMAAMLREEGGARS